QFKRTFVLNRGIDGSGMHRFLSLHRLSLSIYRFLHLFADSDEIRNWDTASTHTRTTDFQLQNRPRRNFAFPFVPDSHVSPRLNDTPTETEKVDGSHGQRFSDRGLDQFQPNAVAYSHGSALHGVKLYFIVLGVQQLVQMSAAGSHAPRHLCLGDALLAHGLFHLPCQHPLNGVVGRVLVKSLFLEKVIQGRADVRILAHRSTSFCLARRSRNNALCNPLSTFDHQLSTAL